MGGGQPYLYNPPAAYNFHDPYNGFNPKRVSQASLAPKPVRPKQEGPLLNFNRHPDSYLITPYGQTNATPMHKNTKNRVSRARKIQLAFRILQLIGAIGLLVCVICIKIPKTTEGWIVRLPVGVDVLVSIYGTYNMSQKSRAKPAASNASYQGFAMVMDAGLIPFFVFTALLGNAHHKNVPGTKDRWESFFDSVEATNQVMQITWLAAAVVGGLHAISLLLDIYLFMMYRKISQLPPDMNPLEDNLTSRRKAKHRYKNSEATLINEKHLSEISGTTAASSQARISRMSASAHSHTGSRTISFRQSRSGEDDSFSPHNPKTARISMYQQQALADSQPQMQRRDVSDADSAFSNRMSAMPAQPTMFKRSSVVSSMHSNNQGHSAHNSREELQQDNWFVIGDGTEDGFGDQEENSPYGQHAPQRASQSAPNVSRHHYHPVSRDSPGLDNSQHFPEGHPLRMNPPTPRSQIPPTPPPQPISPVAATKTLSPPSSIGFSHRFTTTSDNDDRSRTMQSDVSAVTASSSRYSVDEYGSDYTNRTAPSRQLYGDLASAMRGVRHQEVISPRPKSLVGSLHWANSEVGSSDVSSNAGAHTHRREVKSMIESGTGTVVRKPVSPVSALEDDDDDDVPLGARYGTGSGYARVVSRSGVDVNTSGNSRRREVSGKVAEEGRAGSGWMGGGMFSRNGVVT